MIVLVSFDDVLLWNDVLGASAAVNGADSGRFYYVACSSTLGGLVSWVLVETY